LPAKRWVLVCVLTAALLAACGHRGVAGAGEDIDACRGYVEYESLRQPVPTSGHDVLEFADVFLRIMRRVDLGERVLDRDGKHVTPDAEVGRAYATLESSVKVLRDRVRQAQGDGAAIGTAVAELTDSDAFTKADTTIATFYATRCDRGAYRSR
jgi:predicted small secreted protein